MSWAAAVHQSPFDVVQLTSIPFMKEEEEEEVEKEEEERQ